jgi:hypothetical protein
MSAVYIRGVGLEGSTAEGRVGAVLRNLPGTLPGLEDLVASGGSINHVGDPGVPIVQISTSKLIPIRFPRAPAGDTYQPGSIWSGWNSGQLTL